MSMYVHTPTTTPTTSFDAVRIVSLFLSYNTLIGNMTSASKRTSTSSKEDIYAS